MIYRQTSKEPTRLVRYGGNGITFSQIASEIVSASIAGGKDADATLFDFKA